MSAATAGLRVGYILRSYPRLSQTFILNEILALERLGVRVDIFAISDPREPVAHAQVADVRATVHYLTAAHRRARAAILREHALVALASPHRYLGTLRYLARHTELGAGYTTSSRHACFLQAVYLAGLLRRKARRSGEAIHHLHAHFAHDPALVALLTHRLTGIPYSFTAHARDLYQIPAAGLAERAERARAVVTVCQPNVRYMQAVLPAPLRDRVRLVRNGVDLRTFQPAPRPAAAAERPLIVSIGRLVEKKGFPDLLSACRRLKQAGYRFRCEIYGDGPLRAELAATVERLGLADEVLLAGARTQQELLGAYQRADLFALTPFVAQDGDRDGLPTVLVEAMACGVPVVSTRVVGVPELVTHGRDGLLAEPRDVDGIAACLAALLGDPARRVRLGAAARRTVAERFDLHASARQMAALFEGQAGGQPCARSH
jgi:glycosyltransferase involved in cell wall biosynthesis